MSVTMNQTNFSESVIPCLTRNPVVRLWIPASAGMTGEVVIPGLAGMTWLSFVFNSTDDEKAMRFFNLTSHRIP